MRTSTNGKYPRRKATRLSRGELRGPGLSHFTVRMHATVPEEQRNEVLSRLVEMLLECTRRYGCKASAYCLMPDHCHVLMHALHDDSDPWLAIVSFKRDSACWLTGRSWWKRWQDRFDVRGVAPTEGVREVEAYILNNPVRKGLVVDWRDWPYSGGELRGDPVSPAD